MENNQYVRWLKSQYSDKSKTENLVVPLSDKAWELLAELNGILGAPLPKIIETMLEDAFDNEWWCDWIDSTEPPPPSSARDNFDERLLAALPGKYLH